MVMINLLANPTGAPPQSAETDSSAGKRLQRLQRAGGRKQPVSGREANPSFHVWEPCCFPFVKFVAVFRNGRDAPAHSPRPPCHLACA